jgi:hypothetical protein
MLFRFLFQFLLWTLLFYLLFKVLRLLFVGRPAPRAPQQDHQSVNGQRQKKSLDLSNADVEDAKFHEVKKK